MTQPTKRIEHAKIRVYLYGFTGELVHECEVSSGICSMVTWSDRYFERRGSDTEYREVPRPF